MLTSANVDGSTPPQATIVDISRPGWRDRLRPMRRRRLVLQMRDWLAIGVIACFSLTLFTITFFSLIGR